jgi:hypothetical protein
METMNSEQGAAECRAKAKLGFINHLVMYVLVIGALVIVNLLTSRQHIWFVWPMFGWGIAILMHGLGVFAFGPEGRLYGRLLDRERRHEV